MSVFPLTSPPREKHPPSPPMGLRIRTNVPALTVRRHVSQSGASQATAMRRLASGLRIATAADDAAGLGISERMRAKTRSFAVAERNVQDGLSLARVAESVTGEIQSMFHRMRELGVRSLNDTLRASDRVPLTAEYQEMAAEITRIAQQAEFNGLNILTVNQTIDIQAGTEAGETIGIDLIRLPFLGTILGSLTLDNDVESAQAIGLLDGFGNVLSNHRGELGSTMNRLESALSTIRSQRENLTASESRIRDADIAVEAAALARASILQQAGIAILAQANAQPQLALALLG